MQVLKPPSAGFVADMEKRYTMIRFSEILLCLSLLISLGCPVAGQSLSAGIGSAMPGDSLGAPVIVASDTLFLVSARILSFTPADRARAISEKLTRIIEDRSFSPDSIATQETEVGSEIVAGDIIIMTVTNADATTVGMDRPTFAREIVTRIRASIVSVRQQHSISSILRAVVYSLITTLCLLLLLWALRWLFRQLYSRLRAWQGSRIPTLKLQKLEILTAERATQALMKLARLTRFIATLLLLYAAASLILGYFPQTRHVSRYLASRLWSLIEPLIRAVVDYLPDLVVVVVLGIVGFYAIRLVRFFFNSVKAGHIALPGFYVEWADTTYKVARLAIIALLIVLMFPYLPGSESPAFKGVSIFVGILFSLGSTSVVANMVAGLILTYMRPFKLADRVKIADTVGDIEEKTILVTRIRTIKNVLITIPNAMVLNSHIINYSSSVASEPLVLHTAVTIGYDAPWRKVHELLVSAAISTEHIMREPQPFVYQLSLDDFYVRYELNAYTDSPRAMAKIYSDLHQNIQDKFNEAGVEIMSPHYRSVRDGAVAAIPAEYPASKQDPKSLRISVNRKDTATSQLDDGS